MQSTYRVSTLRPPSRSRSQSNRLRTINEVEDIMPPPPPNDPDLRSTKEWTNEITGMSGISKLAKFFLQQKQELNNRRKNENKNEIDTDYRLKRKRDFNATIRACKKTVDSLILLPTYFSSPQLHSLIFKLSHLTAKN